MGEGPEPLLPGGGWTESVTHRDRHCIFGGFPWLHRKCLRMNKSSKGYFQPFIADTLVAEAVLQGICSQVSSLTCFIAAQNDCVQKGPLKVIETKHPPCSEQRHLQLAQVAQSPTQISVCGAASPSVAQKGLQVECKAKLGLMRTPVCTSCDLSSQGKPHLQLTHLLLAEKYLAQESHINSWQRAAHQPSLPALAGSCPAALQHLSLPHCHSTE